MERFTATLELQGRGFPITLHARTLLLGPAGPVSYYWLDSSALRRRPPGPNFRSCVDHWWAAMEIIGAADEIDTQVNRVWAECYPLVNTARSLQEVYLDAQLAPNVETQYATARWDDQSARLAERAFSLPADAADRLRVVARDRDAAGVRAALEDLFLGPMPPPEKMPVFQEAARVWIGDGVVALRTRGSTGLNTHIAKIGEWIAKFRKRGGEDRVRMFLNMFAYESKVAFHLCFANLWIGLIPWLREHRGLDAPSERFLRLWHHQNQPGEDDAAGPGGNRDPFCGQVLSLHPVSAFLMNDSAHLQALGAWIAHPEYDRLIERNEVGTCTAYWDLVAAILIATHEYKHVRDHWHQTRTTRPLVESNDRVASAPRDESPPPIAIPLEEYAAEHALVCPACGGAAKFLSGEPSASEDEGALVAFQCQACSRPFDATITAADFESWIRADAP